MEKVDDDGDQEGFEGLHVLAEAADMASLAPQMLLMDQHFYCCSLQKSLKTDATMPSLLDHCESLLLPKNCKKRRTPRCVKSPIKKSSAADDAITRANRKRNLDDCLDKNEPVGSKKKCRRTDVIFDRFSCSPPTTASKLQKRSVSGIKWRFTRKEESWRVAVVRTLCN